MKISLLATGSLQQAMRSVVLCGLLLALLASNVFAWPTSSQWIAVPKNGSPIHDPQGDANGSRNIVPDGGNLSAAYVFNDGVNIYFRFRLDDDPTGTGGQGLLKSFGWGFEIDTDQNADDYEWLMMCDGITSPEIVALRENTEKSHLGDPSDTAERIAAQYPLAGNYQITAADTCYDSQNNPTGVCNAQYDYRDYFLDYKIPYSVFKAATGITDTTLIRFFVGSSSAANNLTENGADLVAGSDLYSMASDFVTPFGTLPSDLTFYDGKVRFVDSLNGTLDRNVEAPGNPLFLRIDDFDQTNQLNPSGVLVVTVTSPTGDSERVNLYATGVQGKYTGSLPTSGTVNSPGTLYILPTQTAAVTYLDAVTANRSQNIARTDTILFAANGTDIAVTKSVDNLAPAEGQVVTFTIAAANQGPSNVTSLSITDQLPAGLTYLSHTTSQGAYTSGTGIWSITTNLAAGATATLTLRATVNAGTSGLTLVNTARLTASTPSDGYAANNTASATVKIGGTDLRVTKSVDEPLPLEGDSIVYTVRVLNLGPSNTSGVQVTDLLPPGISYVSHTVTQGTYTSGSGLWNVGVLNNGAGALLRITATVNAGTRGTTITNTASLAASTQPDTNPGNNSDSAAIRVEYLDLSLTKKVRRYAPSTTSFGDNVAANVTNTVEFQVEVKNNGPHNASGIVVTETLPIGLTYVAGSATVTNGTYNSSTGAWALGSLPDKATATLLFRATVNNGTAGQILNNEARITAVNQPDSKPGDEYDVASVAVNGTDLRITKTVNNATPNPGASVTWTVTITNDGPNQATGVTASDLLPTGVTRTSHTTSQGTWSATGGNPSYVWSVGTINVNASATLTIVTSVNAGTTGQTIVNNAFITGADQTDPNDGNNVASASIYVSGTDLAVTKTVNDATPNIGQDITYTITATNKGPAAATGVVVHDLLPPELAYVSHAPAAASYVSATGLWTIGNLAVGASTSLTITAKVKSGGQKLVIANTATVTAAQADPVPANNTATVDIFVNATDLAVAKTVSNATPNEGSNIVYTITVTNGGLNNATGIEIDDILPAGVTYVSSVPSPGHGYYAAGLWLLGNLSSSSSATLQITASVDSGTSGSTITNTASLLKLDQIDTDSSNDSASVAIAPATTPTLTLVKSADTASAAPGQTITYSLTTFNSGPGGAVTVIFKDHMSPFTSWNLDAYGAGQPFQLVDSIPASGLTLGAPVYSNDQGATWTYTPISTGGGAPVGHDATVTNWRIPMNGTMRVNGSLTLRYKVQVK